MTIIDQDHRDQSSLCSMPTKYQKAIVYFSMQCNPLITLCLVSKGMVCVMGVIMGLFYLPGCVAQSETYLATDASLSADPGVTSLIPAWSHTFVEIDNEIISMVILLLSAESFKKGCCQLQAKVCARSSG